MRFNDKVAVVTGASKGIGKAAAIGFALKGTKVVVVDIDKEQGSAAVEEIRSQGGEAVFLMTDVSKENEVLEMVDQIRQRYGRLDILVNNAGIYRQGDAAVTALEQWEDVLDVNLTGAFLCIKYAYTLMKEQGGGIVINVASEAGLVGIKGQVAYNVSKGGLITLTRSCAVDFAEVGIRVNCVCPGTTDTPLVQEAVDQTPDPKAARRHLEEIRPLNRLGRPDEIASAILYLASPEAGYATGAVLSIDGGYTAQ